MDPADDKPVAGVALRPIDSATTDADLVRDWWSAPGRRKPAVLTVTGELLGASPLDGWFADFLTEFARTEAPRRFAIVEEYGDEAWVRVAAYGLAYSDHADVNSVEGDFPLKSASPESALAVFRISTGDPEVSRLHLVWLDTARPTDDDVL